MPERVMPQKPLAAVVSPLGAFGGKATHEHRIRAKLTIRAIAVPAYHKMASVLQEGDFVLYQQLATLQLHDLEMVDR
jgi:hypothetical protein